ncbi:Cof-type HAD-IIB family hydrolase [Aquibacillus halophilus]|uniref:Cof-type HAD-IIB family hydrolase n=1 Tax=Aquibacillus halophilus TaxID=930132 RepID=A0A6A8DDV5_9BACI|nr:HAD family hydrolase [Aquibacillus halophilus]MRH43875.1 Cof-type HAD-IIB family hydrolase [Aquibacillus halophilus]
MTKYQAVFLDIDGTVLTQDDRVEQSTKIAIQQIQDKGIEVFLATGRPVHEIAYLADELNINSFIGYNGAFAICDNQEIVKEAMNPAIVEQFTTIARSKGHEMLLFSNRQNLFLSLESPISKQIIEFLHFKNNAEFTNDNYGDILSMCLMNLGDEDLSFYETNENLRLSPVHADGMRNDFDVIRESVNKGHAVSKVLKHLGISPENAIAFGDGMNDKEMLTVVGEGFAMGNAHPLLFKHAKHRTTDVSNSGIFNGLKSLGLVE